MLKDDPMVGRLSDIWALGCILYELAYDMKAFYGDWGVFEYSFGKCALDLPDLPIPIRLNCFIKEVVKELLHPNWEDRPTASAVLAALNDVWELDTLKVRVLTYPQLGGKRLDLNQRQLQYLLENYPQLRHLRLNFPHLGDCPQLIQGQSKTTPEIWNSKDSLLLSFHGAFNGTLWHDDGNMLDAGGPARMSSPSLKFTSDSHGWEKLRWKPFW
jgi:serine/threonine protein kinase